MCTVCFTIFLFAEYICIYYTKVVGNNPQHRAFKKISTECMYDAISLNSNDHITDYQNLWEEEQISNNPFDYFVAFHFES